MLFPFIWMVFNSFNSEENIFRQPPALIPDKLFTREIFSNYIRVLSEFHFANYTWNSTVVAGLSSLGQIFTCSMAGFAFARMKFRGASLVYGVLLATFMLPVQVTIVPEYILMGMFGWENFLPLIVPSMLVGSFGTFMFREYFGNLPNSLIESSVIDGIKPFTILFRIFLPIAQVPLVTLFIIAFMFNWNDLLRAILYINDTELSTVTMGLSQFKSQYEAQWDLLLTGGVLSILPLIVIFLSLQKYIINVDASSGMKG